MLDIHMVLLVGLIAGLIHQLVDRGKANEWIALVRGSVIGAIAGYVIYITTGNISQMSDYAVISLVFGAGYSGDSVLLNIWERYVKHSNLPPKEKKELEEIGEEVFGDEE